MISFELRAAFRADFSLSQPSDTQEVVGLNVGSPISWDIGRLLSREGAPFL
jgi:hypothetical protein